MEGGGLMALRKGDVVTFDITTEPIVQGHRGKRATGIGAISDNEIDYSCWPPGRTVRVIESPDYKPGTHLAVCTHNLRKVKP